MPKWEEKQAMGFGAGTGILPYPKSKLLQMNGLSSNRSSPKASAYNPDVTEKEPDELRHRSLPAPAGRVLGLDVGSRRIGVAISDPLGITAQGLETLQRRNKRHDLAALERVIREYEVCEIVVGLPLRMSGAEGIQSEKMQGFAQELRKRFQLPVHLWDERLTSAEANRLLRETELSIEKRAKAVDRMAATLILQGWMESRR
ncbi:MAG: Holliday junction resolvase RuvX [Candidatus Sulfotelmatobacter sp.]